MRYLVRVTAASSSQSGNWIVPRQAFSYGVPRPGHKNPYQGEFTIAILSKSTKLCLVLAGSIMFSHFVIVLTLAADDITQPRLPYTSDSPQVLCCASDQAISRDLDQLCGLSHSVKYDWLLGVCARRRFCSEGWILKRTHFPWQSFDLLPPRFSTNCSSQCWSLRLLTLASCFPLFLGPIKLFQHPSQRPSTLEHLFDIGLSHKLQALYMYASCTRPVAHPASRWIFTRASRLLTRPIWRRVRCSEDVALLGTFANLSTASVNDTTSKAVESSTAPAFVRNDDPLTIALRSEGTLDLDALVRLHQARPPVSDAAASDGSTSTAVFSSLEASSDTKPTSTSTNYPLYDTEGKCKETIEYSSSLSATHGSGSEAELDMKASQRIDLLGTGSWMSDNSTSKHILKDPTRSRPRNHKKSWSRKKKPPVIVHQDPLSSNLEGASRDGVAVTPLGCGKVPPTCLSSISLLLTLSREDSPLPLPISAAPNALLCHGSRNQQASTERGRIVHIYVFHELLYSRRSHCSIGSHTFFFDCGLAFPWKRHHI